MAFGKADTGLIQADKARYGVDANVAGAAAAGQFAKQMMGMQMQMDKNKAATLKGVSDAYNKEVNVKPKEGEKGYTEESKSFVTQVYNWGKGLFANSSKVDQADIVSKVNKLNDGAKEFSANTNAGVSNVLSPGYDDVDEYFAKAAHTPGYHEIVPVNGVAMRKVKAPEGYPSKDGYVYFDVSNDPMAQDKWYKGSTAVMGAWNNNIKGTQEKPIKWEATGADGGIIASNVKSDLTGANYWQAQDIINQDHSEDNIKNPFAGQFTSGQLSPEYYEDINSTDDNKSYISVYRKVGRNVSGPQTQEESENFANDRDKDGIPDTIDNPRDGEYSTKVTYDPSKGPMGGLTKEELSGYLKGTMQDGTRDFNNKTKINDFIIDKFSKYHGEVTSDFYKKRQAEEMKKAQRYFVMPGEETPFMDGEINFPTAEKIKTQRQSAFKDQLFEGFAQGIGTQFDAKGVDMTTSLGDEDGDMFKSLQKQYGRFDDVTLKADDGVLTVAVGEAEPRSYDLKTMTNAKMQELKSFLNSSSFDNYSLLGGLGDDANAWDLTAPQYSTQFKTPTN
tara:strand:- start:266 stop:1945 length:1680 start_codon:yes stop_codon:yes gene_type:complete